jgi:hypothetical protein
VTEPARAGLAVGPHPNAHAFLARAEPWLMLCEDEHNLVLGLAAAFGDTRPAAGPGGYVFGTRANST